MRSEVKKFGYIKANSLEEAVSLLSKLGSEAQIIAGGSDILSRIKNGIAYHRPRYLIDITGLNLNYIRFSEAEGLRIGATTTLSEVNNHPLVRERFRVLAEAAGRAASPQIRNVATVAGDVLQEVWCWYLRYNYDCWRNGGNICYGAIGDNRFYHSIFGGRLCYAVHAGDVAPALFALDAKARIISPTGEKVVSMEQLMPGIVVVDGRIKENTLRRNEILTEFIIPSMPSGTKSSFYKVSERGSWDFALASAAVRARVLDGVVSDARIVLGGVDVKPRRVMAAEDFINGKSLSEEVIQKTAEIALQDATPLTFGTGNAFRVTLAKGAVKKALRKIAS